jgi:NAD(P)-dependent dehydrogenase (short-subunit alcohol dehydrogenase family)
MIALVTGATSDVGVACVERLREAGMTVAQAPPASDRASSDRVVEDALRLGGGRLDVLVTVADMVFDGSIEATSEAVFRELLEVNLTAAFRVSRACFGAMRAQGGGSMIHIASDAGVRAAHDTAAYSVMSAGVIALAELFAAEGAAYGIRSNALCPRSGTDVAPIVAWLASDESSHMSGATLRVDDAAGAAMTVDTRIA